MGADIIQIEEGLNTLENQITNVDTNKAPPYYSEFSADSSSSNSPVEDRPSGYFGNNEVPVVVPNGPLDFTSRSNTLPHVRTDNNDALIVCVSALYAKLLVVMGMAFPIAEIISNDVPLIFYNSFYLYLYFGSIFFLIYAYIFLLRTKSLSTDAFKNQVHSIRMKMPRLEVNWSEIPMPKSLRNVLPKKKEPDGKADKDDKISVTTSAYKPPKYTITETSNHGSMYLKMGAVLFGIGSMIYSGLEFGQYFELRSGADCGNILMAISPIARMIFTFLQMYFIFLNSRVAISKHTTIARFGLMHMIGTNLCIWLNVLVQETKHEIAHLTYNADEHHADLFPGHSVESHSKDHHTSILGDDHHDSNESFDSEEILDHLLRKSALNHTHHNVVRRTVPAQDELSGCRRINLMGNVVSSASPFLFPCTIEYSLLCAGVLYVMWKNINFSKTEKNMADGDSDISTFIARKVRHHYSVDCARASRGLFTGIFILVLTIISLILFYVLISNDKFKRFAILEANIIELSIYSLAIISVIVGMKQMRELEFILEGDIELDNILLIIAQAGVYIYASFTIIGGYFSLQASHTLPLLTAVLTLIQTTLQTLFILDGSRRCCYTADQLDRKPGREMVTFLLVCNLAMWAISTFETSRADVHPTQLHFYGIWAWTIISHVAMPLAIFYRFHVTVCLGEIWKRSYKLKTDFMGL
ncbi:Otopetrin-2 [Armadillidium nasatum]|uniref:Otopetrin-2 n=1 Tax=Armadillidium nasatum TaxID=96803 RepID=A0A5N5SR91_9CRUS|nr:Otopetrin-2 [Armadillidium nasatum]